MTKLVASIFQTNYKSQAVAAEGDDMILNMHLRTYGKIQTVVSEHVVASCQRLCLWLYRVDSSFTGPHGLSDCLAYQCVLVASFGYQSGSRDRCHLQVDNPRCLTKTNPLHPVGHSNPMVLSMGWDFESNTRLQR